MRDFLRLDWSLIFVIVFTLTLPFWLTADYPLHLAITIAMYTVAALGARLLLLTGVWSFGQGVFLSIGAYVAAIGVLREGMSFWLMLPLAGVIAAAVAAVVGFPSLRIKEVYFGIFTMVLIFAVREIIILTPSVTGGTLGLNELPPLDPISFNGITLTFDSKTAEYYVVAGLFLLAFIVMRRIDNSRIGGVLSAIRQNENLAASVGINVSMYRLAAFVVASALAGLAGAFSAGYYSVAHPEVWGLWPSIFIVVYAIIGGLRSPVGPLIGSAAAIVGVEVLRSTQAYQSIALGVCLALVVFVAPNGLLGLLDLRNGLPAVAARLPRRIAAIRHRADPGSSSRPGNDADVAAGFRKG